jgi:hypothetical protein
VLKNSDLDHKQAARFLPGAPLPPPTGPTLVSGLSWRRHKSASLFVCTIRISEWMPDSFLIQNISSTDFFLSSACIWFPRLHAPVIAIKRVASCGQNCQILVFHCNALYIKWFLADVYTLCWLYYWQVRVLNVRLQRANMAASASNDGTRSSVTAMQHHLPGQLATTVSFIFAAQDVL